MRSCLEKFFKVALTPPPLPAGEGEIGANFSWFQSVPWGHEILIPHSCLEKGRWIALPLHPSYDFSWFHGVPWDMRY
ncbi:hypothetical protein SBDP1_1350002 [Syntrophobacter sp. SbD1]|nr:hypothetical protein SBDP1_1350002 [Syntrophobacter sp. SbD1]